MLMIVKLQAEQFLKFITNSKNYFYEEHLVITALTFL